MNDKNLPPLTNEAGELVSKIVDQNKAAAEPDHVGYFEALKHIAKGIEVEICEDVAELEKTLSDYSVEILNAVERLKIKHKIA